MHTNPKFAQTGSETEFVESTVQPNPVDINDFSKNKVNAEVAYSGLKPSLRPLKWSNMKKKDNSKELDLEALEANQRKIVYIKTFNHVKNEAIVSYPDNEAFRSLYNISQELKSIKHGSKGKKKGSLNLDTQINLSFFQMNKKKFDPLKQIKKKKSVEDVKVDENSSAGNDFAFLTGVNIQGAEKQKEEESHSDNQEEEENEEDKISPYKPRFLKEWPITNEDPAESQPKGTEVQRQTREPTNLPTIRKPTFTNNEKLAASVSEARYQRYQNQKPKMYITAKTNSVQAFGRPANYHEHLARVYNKESTPTVPYPLIDHLGPRKDMRKAILESYLAQFNVEALKEIDENLYAYAKEKGY